MQQRAPQFLPTDRSGAKLAISYEWSVALSEIAVPQKCVRCLLRCTVMTLALCIAQSSLAFAQLMGKQTGCYADSIVANPNRPTVANPADITQYGVLELEYGWDHDWPEPGIDQTSLGGLAKFGLLCDIEFRWTTTEYTSQTDASGTHRTIGDNWLGPQVRFYRQTRYVPAMAF